LNRPFITELDELQNKILEMGGLVETAIHNSIRSLVERNESLMGGIWENEERINQLYARYLAKNVAVVAIQGNDPNAIRVDELDSSDISDTLPEMKIRVQFHQLGRELTQYERRDKAITVEAAHKSKRTRSLLASTSTCFRCWSGEAGDTSSTGP